MNDNNQNLPKGRLCRRATRYLYVLAALTVLCIIIGIAVSVTALDNTTRYFSTPEASIAVLAAFTLCSALSIAAFFVFDRDEAKTNSIAASKLRYLTIPEVLSTFYFTFYAFTTLRQKIFDTATGGEKNSSLTTIGLTLLLLAFALSFVYSCRYFGFNHTGRRHGTLSAPSRTFFAVMGISRIVFFLYIITTLYFDMSVELNSPFKLIIQFTAAACALQTCADVRGMISGVTRRTFIAAKTLSATFGILCFTLMWGAALGGVPLPDSSYTFYAELFLAISIFNAYEIVKIAFQTTPAPREASQDAPQDDPQDASQDTSQNFEERNDET